MSLGPCWWPDSTKPDGLPFIWHHRAPNSGSILDAMRFVATYTDTTETFPNPDVAQIDPGVFLVPLSRAAEATGEPIFLESIQRLPPSLTRPHISALLHPRTAFVRTNRSSSRYCW